jgi:UDP-glucose 4-epimerase
MDLLSFVLQTEAIDTIMHFAAQVSVCHSEARWARAPLHAG